METDFEMVAAVEELRGLAWEEMRGRRGDGERGLARYLGRTECGLGLKGLGAAASGVDYATVSAAVKRIRRRLAGERKFAQRSRYKGN
jgi:chromosomal replication initiation ATPase DnaA